MCVQLRWLCLYVLVGLLSGLAGCDKAFNENSSERGDALLEDKQAQSIMSGTVLRTDKELQAPILEPTPQSAIQPSNVTPENQKSDAKHANLPAFPGAGGDGAASRGGRGGKVLIVDRLDDPCPTAACTTDDLADPGKTTPGTLRWALLQDFPRTVVFQVSGLIALQEDHIEQIDGQLHIKRLAAIRIKNPYLTVAGQTAPAGGITVVNNGISILAHDVVLRYLRFRTGRGSRAFFRGQQNPQTLMIENGAERVIVDHCSFSWMPAEGVSIFTGELWDGSKGSAKDITLSWNIIGEGLIQHEDGRGHPNAAMMNGFDGDEKYAASNITLHHNLLLHTQKRNGDMLGHSARLINNLIYNWQWQPTILAGGIKADLIGNIWKHGPLTGKQSKGIHLVPAATDVEGYDNNNWWHAVSGEPSLYLQDNVLAAAQRITDNKKLLCYYRERDKGCQNENIQQDWFRTEPMMQPAYSVGIEAADAAEANILQYAGANQRVNSKGKWVNNRDEVDERYVKEYAEASYLRKRFPWHEDEVGGYPIQVEGAAPPDTDRDGMPDGWEQSQGLNPDDAADAQQIPSKGDGYTWLELFINGERS